MADKVSFDGSNKLIIVSTGITELDFAEDVYSAWKRWISVSDNAKYLEAIRVVGGDSISPTKTLGSTFFMTNGWKIRPYEGDHRLVLNGNVFTDPSGSSIFSETVGNYRVFTEMMVSNLSDSNLAQMDEIEYASFQNQVTIDAISGTTGTAYPRGTLQMPVNNLTDAVAIAATRGIKTLYFIGNFTFGSSVMIANYLLKGEGWQKSTFTFQAGSITAYCDIQNARITGMTLGTTGVQDCFIDTFGVPHSAPTTVDMIIQHCILGGTLQIPAEYQGTMMALDCWSGETSTPPVVSFNGASADLIVRNWSGAFEIQNFTQPNNVSIDVASGKAILASSVTNGNIRISGVCVVENNSTGSATVDLTGVVLPESSYDGAVFIDPDNGVAGTNYPIGIATRPVSNIADAVTIANLFNLREFRFRGTLVVATTFTDWTFKGIGSVQSDVIFCSDATLTNCMFEKCTVTGSMTSEHLQLLQCILSTVTGFSGLVVDSGLHETIGMDGTGTFYAKNCAAMSEPTIIDMIGANRELNAEISSGRIRVINAGTGSKISMTIGIGGVLELASSCTAGTATVDGVGTLINNSSMTITTALISRDSIEMSRKLQSNRAVISSDGTHVTIYDDDDTTILHEFDITDSGRVRTPA